MHQFQSLVYIHLHLFFLIVEQAMDACWLGTAVHDCIEMYTDFHMRFNVPLGRFPYSLVWFIASDPALACPNRRHMATDLLSMSSPEIGDETSEKIQFEFEAAVKEAADHGAMSNLDFYDLLGDIFAMWKADNQEIEGVASIIKRIMDICPHITWQLLSSRVVIRKFLADVKTKMDRDEFISMCERFHAHAQEASWAFWGFRNSGISVSFGIFSGFCCNLTKVHKTQAPL